MATFLDAAISPITLRVSSSSLQINNEKLPYRPGFYVFTDGHNQTPQDPRCRASGAHMEDPKHRAVITALWHESVNDLINVWIIPNSRPGRRRNEFDIERNRLGHSHFLPLRNEG